MRYPFIAVALATGAVVACDPTAVSVDTYAAAMTGPAETPAIVTTATGSATIINTVGVLSFLVTVNGLSGPATMAHIHVGAAGVAGPIVYTFTPTASASGTIASGVLASASLTISQDSLLSLMNSGNAYVNVHTTANPNGEVRGQLLLQN